MILDKTNILVVDDRPENILALSHLIQSDDIQIHSAESAEQALDLLMRHDFALALLDVQMPRITGFELARLIRGVKKFKNLPVIFVTAQSHDQTVLFEGYETGAVDLMFKPLDPHVVRSKVRVFVQLHQQSRQLKLQMDELEGLKQQADVANMAKSHFLANMSHEIRTPLTAVLGFSDVLFTEELSKEEREKCLFAIHRNGELLLRIIDDVLDLSKIEAQKLEYEQHEFRMSDLISDVQSTLSLKAQDKGVGLKIHVTEDMCGLFLSDPARIKQVLFNIIGNAIKFTTKGFVEVKARTELVHESRDGCLTKVIFSIEDTGVGLSEDQRQRLFQPFIQADASTRRQFGGTGLGLMISKKIAQALGGDVCILSSTLGQGSIFEVSFQVIRKPSIKSNLPIFKDKIESKEISQKLDGKKILVVDDSPDNRALVSMYLRNSGLTLDFAASAKEALSRVEDIAPDMIFMDIQMPEMDGHEATQILRKSGFEKPIVALTAHAMKEEHERCRQSGCDSILTKPVSKNSLLLCAAKHLDPLL